MADELTLRFRVDFAHSSPIRGRIRPERANQTAVHPPPIKRKSTAG